MFDFIHIFGIINHYLVIFSPLSHIKDKTLIFDKIKFSLKKSEDSDIYNKYIKNLKLDEKNSTSNHLIIETPNIYIATYIKRYYTQKIINIYQKLTEIIPEIEFITNQNKTIKNSFEESIQQEISKSIATLIPEFTFETFVTGPSNLFACNTAKATNMYFYIISFFYTF
jgi:chromosomal replication initiator protein